MNGPDRFTDTTAAIDKTASLLAALASTWDHLWREFDDVAASVQAAHTAGKPSGAFCRLEELLAGLGHVEALTTGALARLEALLSEAGGHGVE